MTVKDSIQELEKHDKNREIIFQTLGDNIDCTDELTIERMEDSIYHCHNGKHARLTLGDMWQQRNNDYKDGYSNIIIHPNGVIGTNWK